MNLDLIKSLISTEAISLTEQKVPETLTIDVSRDDPTDVVLMLVQYSAIVAKRRLDEQKEAHEKEQVTADPEDKEDFDYTVDALSSLAEEVANEIADGLTGKTFKNYDSVVQFLFPHVGERT